MGTPSVNEPAVVDGDETQTPSVLFSFTEDFCNEIKSLDSLDSDGLIGFEFDTTPSEVPILRNINWKLNGFDQFNPSACGVSKHIQDWCKKFDAIPRSELSLFGDSLIDWKDFRRDHVELKHIQNTFEKDDVDLHFLVWFLKKRGLKISKQFLLCSERALKKQRGPVARYRTSTVMAIPTDDFRVPILGVTRVQYRQDNVNRWVLGEASWIFPYLTNIEFVGVNRALHRMLERREHFTEEVPMIVIRLARQYKVSEEELCINDVPMKTLLMNDFDVQQLFKERAALLLWLRLVHALFGRSLFQDHSDIYAWNVLIHHFVGKCLPKGYFSSYPRVRTGGYTRDVLGCIPLQLITNRYVSALEPLRGPIQYQAFGDASTDDLRFLDEEPQPWGFKQAASEYAAYFEALFSPFYGTDKHKMAISIGLKCSTLLAALVAAGGRIGSTLAAISQFVVSFDYTVSWVSDMTRDLCNDLFFASRRMQADAILFSQHASEFVSEQVTIMFQADHDFEKEESVIGVIKACVLAIVDGFGLAVVSEVKTFCRLFLQETRKYITVNAAKSAVDAVLKGIWKFFDLLKTCYYEKSLRPLYSGESGFAKWYRHVQCYSEHMMLLIGTNQKAFETAREYGSIPYDITKTISQQQYIRDSIRLRDEAGRFLPLLSESQQNECKKMLQSLKMNIGNQIVSYGNVERQEPFLVFIYGAPGCGKTRMMKNLISKWANENSLDPKNTYLFRPGANFQDGLLPFHHTIILDDPDVSKTDDSYLRFIIDAKNTKELPVESAGVESKGKIFIAPRLLVIISNSLSLGAARITNPDAVRRRFDLVLHASVVEGKHKLGQLTPEADLIQDTRYQVQEFTDFKLPSTRTVGEPLTAHQMYDHFTRSLETFLQTRRRPDFLCPVCKFDDCFGCVVSEATYEPEVTVEDIPFEEEASESSDEESEDTLVERKEPLGELVTITRLQGNAAMTPNSGIFTSMETQTRAGRTMQETATIARTVTQSAGATVLETLDTTRDTAQGLEQAGREIQQEVAEIRRSSRHVRAHIEAVAEQVYEDYMTVRTTVAEFLTYPVTAVAKITAFLLLIPCGVVMGVADVVSSVLGMLLSPVYEVLVSAAVWVLVKIRLQRAASFVKDCGEHMRRFVKAKWHVLLTLATGAAVIGGVVMISKGKDEDKTEEAKKNPTELKGTVGYQSLPSERIPDIPIVKSEAIVAVGQPLVSIPEARLWARNTPASDQNPVIIPKATGNSYTLDNMKEAVTANLVTFYNENGTKMMFGLIVVDSLCLVPDHITLGFSTRLTIAHTENYRFSLTKEQFESHYRKLNGELGVLYCPNFRCLHRIDHMLMEYADTSTSSWDEGEVFGLGKAKGFPKNQTCETAGGFTRIVTMFVPTIRGDCGRPYFVRKGKGWFIGAVHFGEAAPGQACGAWVERSAIKNAAREFGCTNQVKITVAQCFIENGVNTLSKPEPMNARSHFWAAQDSGAQGKYIGWCSKKATPLKTKIKDSISAARWRDFEARFCGMSPYWCYPSVKNGMVDGLYVSNFTNMFKNQNTTTIPITLVKLAIRDYLCGLDKLTLTGYHELSFTEAMNGIPESDIGKVDLSTSAGPPYFRPKSDLIKKVGSTFVVDEGWLQTALDVDEMLKNDQQPVYLSMCTEKDEPIKPEKRTRIFNNLPFAINFVSKRIGIWKNLMRTYPSFFECVVGIDMSGVGVGQVVSYLARVDPTLSHIVDSDVSTLDKSFSASMLDMVAKVVYALSFAIDVKPYENYLMIQSLQDIIYNVRGDYVMFPQNPSGFDATVEVNSIALSLVDRVMWYFYHPYEGDLKGVDEWWENFFINPIPGKDAFCTYRANNATCLYGDDLLKALKVELPETYFDDVFKLTGLKVTNSSKTELASTKSKTIFEVEFLKRRFLQRDGLWIAPLSLKSIVRMVLFKKDTFLSDIDHCAVTTTESLKEMFYYGEELYNEWRERCLLVAAEFNLLGNSYLYLPAYEDVYRTWKEKKFQLMHQPEAIWTPLSNHINFQIGFKVTYQNALSLGSEDSDTSTLNMMSIESDREGTIVPEPEAHTTAPTTTVTQVVATTFATAVNSIVRGITTQTPSLPLEDFLFRPTYINTFTLLTSDIFGTLYWNYVTKLWRDVPVIDNRMKYYYAWQASFEVMLKVNSPPGSRGLLIAAMVPLGTDRENYVGYSEVANIPSVYTISQLDSHAFIDLSRSASVVLKVPYIYPKEYMTFSQEMKNWKLAIYVLEPVTLATGTTATIGVFCTLDKSSKLIGMKYQSGSTGENGTRMTQYVKDFAKKPLSSSFKAAASVADWFGYTKDLVEDRPVLVKQIQASNYTFDGEFVGRIVNYMTPQRTERIPRHVSETTFESIANRWTLVNVLPWNSSDVVGTLMGYQYVTPFTSPAAVPEGPHHLPPAGYLGMNFAYWRCNFEFMVMVAVTPFMRGSLQITYQPGNGIAPDYATSMNTQSTFVVDVQQDQCITFGVGYMAKHMACRTAILCQGITQSYNTDFHNGMLHFRIASPLASGNDVLNASVFVFMRCTDVVYSQHLEDITTVAITGNTVSNLRQNIVYQGAIGADPPNVVSHTLVPRTSSNEWVSANGGAPMDCRAMLQMRTPRCTLGTYGDKAMTFYWTTDLCSYPGVGSVAQHYALLFVGVTGGMRYAVSWDLDDMDEVGIVPTRGRVTNSDRLSIIPNMYQAGYNSPNRFAEFEIPAPYNNRYYVTGIQHGGLQSAADLRAVTSGTNEISTIRLAGVFAAHAPDVDLHFFRFTPTFTFTAPTQVLWDTKAVKGGLRQYST